MKNFGLLAFQYSGVWLPVRVYKSAAGYYLGTRGDNGAPVSRESAEYFPDEAAASAALASGAWTQRDQP